ncbi:hypothetical protein BKA67DRAFT_214024 [Truncatella angustata]|uniref:Zn(2)-C6 fungal-type domain-containing protein n=1 Tax=Truncatella angustata TaxID=152316 RepID=A0A9P9A1K5_9PEZI|nr:uncharacterized protein BKA67DRAFT_214024 [Truncatella angustata]KAH6658428.1 hypothetical protein BKA67DRAFT_214024 [Truncatella angustata]
MESAVEKIPKACEPCRKKKVRCDGKQPCQRCQRRPSECSYRQRIRIRKSARHTLSPIIGPSHARSTTNESQSESQIPDASGNPPEPKKQADHARDQLYQSVAATHGNKADSVESSRLFYGPSSQFAFLQQLHREILCFSSHHQPGDREVQEGGPGLDLFVQRSIFFGIAQRTRSNPLPSHMSLISSLPVQQAVEFLAGFKAAASPIVPLFADQELDDLLHHFYSDESDSSLSPQRRALTLAILAIGGLTTAHTDVAELLFIKAKQEAVVCDDVVSLSMIQLSILLAEYQTNMGRPNSAYLNLGVACRKALAMGLHKESDISLVPADILQKRRITLWCLYFHESWQALALGRESALKMSDISASFPDDQPVLVGLCRLAQIAEDGARVIYGRRYESLGQLYVAAEKIGARLREFADQYGIGSASLAHKHKSRGAVASLQLHSVYYHVILLTYRPFLIADSALKPAGGPKEPDTMWLRQACRYAIDAAQDSIVYAASSFRKDEACKTTRYYAFFLDANCVVLMYDMLRHPAKRNYNVDYINMALQMLSSMVQDEPVTVSQNSMKQMLRLVEDIILNGNRVTGPSTELASLASSNTTAVEVLSDTQQGPPHPNFQFPSLNAGSTQSQQFIHFSNLPAVSGQGNFDNALNIDGSAVAYANPLPYFQNDVITTDLFNFFPVDLLSPYNTSSLEGADNHNT